MKIMTAAEIALAEKTTMERLRIPETILMENAASAIVEEIKKRLRKDTPIAFLCGYGNNGGDGFAAARKLIAENFQVTVFRPKDTSRFSKSAEINFNILKNMGSDIRPIEKGTKLENFAAIADALFGTGLKRPVKDEGTAEHFQYIEEANRREGAFKISADIPSGLFADLPSVAETVFKADVTAAFTAMKICQCLYPSKALCGKTVIKNVSIPENLFAGIKRDFLTKKDIPFLKQRAKDTHKGNYGKAVIIGGSADMGGAAAIAAKSALKSGAGLTYLYIGSETEAGFIYDTPEIIVKRSNNFEPSPVIDFINSPKTVALIGNGMGDGKETKEFIKNIVFGAKNTIVIDADGINALTFSEIKEIKAQKIITPHLKEFARLLGASVEEVKKDRLNLAKNFTLSTGTYLVLKSADTIIALPGGELKVCDFGTPALSKGGSGDALAGIITGLAAQGYHPWEAAELAVFILGESAKIAENKTHTLCVTATDVINALPEAMREKTL